MSLRLYTDAARVAVDNVVKVANSLRKENNVTIDRVNIISIDGDDTTYTWLTGPITTSVISRSDDSYGVVYKNSDENVEYEGEFEGDNVVWTLKNSRK